MIFSIPSNYFLSSYALTLTLNAMSLPDYMQASAASGARIMVYMKVDKIDNPNSDATITAENALIDTLNIDLGYDVDLNYRAWTINLVPTYFTNTAEKYIYAAIPRGSSNATTAMIVFPSNKIDVFGRMEQTMIINNQEVTKVVQVGSTDYYYIWLYGEISPSVDGTGASQNRIFITDVQNNLLSPYNSGALDTKKSQTEGLVDDLSERFISKIKDDSTPYNFGIGKDLKVGGNSTVDGNSTVSKDSIVNGNQTIGGDETVNGHSSIGGDITIGGKSTITGDNSVGGNNEVEGDETVKGIGTFQSLIASLLSALNGGSKFGEYSKGVSGAIIDALGNGEMESLTIRRFLEVPEIRFNRTTYIQGDNIQSCAGGQIKSITINKDEDGNNSNTGTIELRLEDNDIGEFDVDDICISIFCNLLDKSQNAVLTVDDGIGNRTVKGFATSMFRITSISGERNEILTYSLRGVSERWTTSYHPQPLSTIAQRGNFSKVERQSLNISGIFTKPYLRIMHDVNYWEFSASMIGCQFGNMENLAILGINMTGYSAYLNNIYMNGTISQFESIEPKMTFNGGGDNQVAEGQTKLMKATITNGYGMDITDRYPYWKITRDTGDVAADNIWNAQATIENGEFYLTCSSTVDDLGGKESALYTVTASDGISKPITETISL